MLQGKQRQVPGSITAIATAEPIADKLREVPQPDFSGITVETKADARETIGKLVKDMELAAVRVLEADKELKARIAEYDRIAKTALPEAMREAGNLTELTMENGVKVAVKDDIKISTNEETRPVCYAWLREHGHDGIIKSTIVVDVAGVPEKKQERIARAALAVGADCERKDTVHPATLLVLVRELLESGKPTPEGVTIFPYKEAVLKYPKSKVQG